MMTSAQWVKLWLGVGLFAVWLALVVLQVPHTDDIIADIKLALLGLGAYHLNDRSNTP